MHQKVIGSNTKHNSRIGSGGKQKQFSQVQDTRRIRKRAYICLYLVIRELEEVRKSLIEDINRYFKDKEAEVKR